MSHVLPLKETAMKMKNFPLLFQTIKKRKFLSNPKFSIFLGNSFYPFYVLTEIVIAEPKIVVPIVGRKYDTNLYVLKDDIVEYEDLLKLPDFRGTNDYPSVYLEEVWENWGDDGHTESKLVGYKFTAVEGYPLKGRQNGNLPCNGF